jgi:hypothetical protein
LVKLESIEILNENGEQENKDLQKLKKEEIEEIIKVIAGDD